jgi:hypothetical protein
MTYQYRHLTPVEGGYGSRRNQNFEGGDVGYAIFQGEQPYDDYAMLLRWMSSSGIWTASFAALGCAFPEEGNPLQDGAEDGERASLVLHQYFGIWDKIRGKTGEHSPSQIGSMSPKNLRNLRT